MINNFQLKYGQFVNYFIRLWILLKFYVADDMTMIWQEKGQHYLITLSDSICSPPHLQWHLGGKLLITTRHKYEFSLLIWIPVIYHSWGWGTSCSFYRCYSPLTLRMGSPYYPIRMKVSDPPSAFYDITLVQGVGFSLQPGKDKSLGSPLDLCCLW